VPLSGGWAARAAGSIAAASSLQNRTRSEAKHGGEQGALADCKLMLRAEMTTQMYPKHPPSVWLQITSPGTQRHRLYSSEGREHMAGCIC